MAGTTDYRGTHYFKLSIEWKEDPAFVPRTLCEAMPFFDTR